MGLNLRQYGLEELVRLALEAAVPVELVPESHQPEAHRNQVRAVSASRARRRARATALAWLESTRRRRLALKSILVDGGGLQKKVSLDTPELNHF